jgi:hypothetical protein
MSTTNTNIDTAGDIERLSKSLEAARGDAKNAEARASELRRSIASKLGLPDDANSEAILARLDASPTETIVSERLAPVEKERDELKARLAEVETRYTDEKVESALREAFAKSGADVRNFPDMLALARPLFTLDPKTGAVRTKADAPNTLPNADPASWMLTELRVKRPHYWPMSIGGGAKGSSARDNPNGVPGDASCFRPGATFNLTGQMRYAKQYGEAAARKASQLFGGGR